MKAIDDGETRAVANKSFKLAVKCFTWQGCGYLQRYLQRYLHKSGEKTTGEKAPTMGDKDHHGR